MITSLINAAIWCSKHKLYVASSILFFIIGLSAKGQAQKTNFVFTATSPTTFGWKAIESGWGVNKITTDSGFVYQTDTSQVMTVSRASDSITNMKVTIAAKLASTGFTKAAMVALGMMAYTDTSAELSPYLRKVDTASLSSRINAKFTTPVGSTAQYIKGDGTLGTTATNTGTVTSIATTIPITGGTITGAGTIGINNAAADNSTKGAASFDAAYFDDNGSGLISWAVASGSATISAGAATLNQPRGKLTYTSPSILAAGTASITLNNSYITSTSIIYVNSNGNGSNLSQVNVYIKSQTAGSAVINVQNLSLLSLFNTSFVIDFFVIN